MCPFVIKQSRKSARAWLLILFQRSLRSRDSLMAKGVELPPFSSLPPHLKCLFPSSHTRGRETVGYHKCWDNYDAIPLPKQERGTHTGHWSSQVHLPRVCRSQGAAGWRGLTSARASLTPSTSTLEWPNIYLTSLTLVLDLDPQLPRPGLFLTVLLALSGLCQVHLSRWDPEHRAGLTGFLSPLTKPA